MEDKEWWKFLGEWRKSIEVGDEWLLHGVLCILICLYLKQARAVGLAVGSLLPKTDLRLDEDAPHPNYDALLEGKCLIGFWRTTVISQIVWSHRLVKEHLGEGNVFRSGVPNYYIDY
ncbi:unnamed protein product [Nippostrongylus brasiliensis]|uniref:Transmembrane protein n=1 Tax=Nippostrongylus brasiliensis TaxID=27835 RepID=A0A0N4XSH7_NIPBR|nr:hypothetical protein Q1695_014826 [Nippostrongylus brasiliensis]VDL69069.1 unnamed protein product [Nippostrongylus brasiliensis]